MQKITAVPCGAVSSDRSQMGPATVWQIEFLNRKLTLPPKRLQKPSPDTPFIQVVSSLRSVPVENGRESAGAKHPKEEEESTLLRFEQRPERSDWTQASSRLASHGTCNCLETKKEAYQKGKFKGEQETMKREPKTRK